MSDYSMGPGWWQASDGKWYPPTASPGQSQTSVPSDIQAGTYGTGYGIQSGMPNVPYLEPQSAKSKSSYKALLIVVLVVILLLIGGGVYLLFAGSTSSPQTAVNTFLRIFNNGDASSACTAVEPSFQSKCLKEMKVLLAFTTPASGGHLTAANYVIDGNQALVTVVGSYCLTVSFLKQTKKQCTSNYDPSKGLPTGSETFATAFSKDSNSSNLMAVPCVLVSGKWYVDLGATFNGSSGNTGNTGTTPTNNSGSSGSSGNTSTSIPGSSSNTGNTGTTPTNNSGSGSNTGNTGNTGITSSPPVP